jgi:tetratricopeptide (TPR) repeat protein
MGDRLYWMLFGTNVRMFRTILLAVASVHLLYFIVIPWLLTRRTMAKSPRLRRYLEVVVATPSLFGDIIRACPRHDLMRLAQLEGRYEQAAGQGYAIVRHRGLPGAFVAEVRSRLADALEALGQDDAAEEQRRLGEGDLETGEREEGRDAAWYITRARQCEATRDYEGACRVLEEGLEADKGMTPEGRAMMTLDLAVKLFMAGRLEESAHRAEVAASLFTDPKRQLLAHRQAGSSLGDLGRLDEAEAHKRRVVELAERIGDSKQLADILGDLAELKRKRGDLAGAVAALDQAAAAVRPTRHLELIRYETLRSWGRFDEALAAVDRASRLDPFPNARAESFTQGIFAFARASVLAEQGKLDEARAALAQARKGVAGDAKVTLWCDASGARIDALQGRRDAALRAIDDADAALAGFTQDRNTRSGVFGNLGRATLALGDFDRALGYWDEYLAAPPQPVDFPVGHYHLAEAYRGLGDNARARAEYRKAIDSGLFTHYVALAQSRLRTLPI